MFLEVGNSKPHYDSTKNETEKKIQLIDLVLSPNSIFIFKFYERCIYNSSYKQGYIQTVNGYSGLVYYHGQFIQCCGFLWVHVTCILSENYQLFDLIGAKTVHTFKSSLPIYLRNVKVKLFKSYSKRSQTCQMLKQWNTTFY